MIQLDLAGINYPINHAAIVLLTVLLTRIIMPRCTVIVHSMHFDSVHYAVYIKDPPLLQFQ